MAFDGVVWDYTPNSNAMDTRHTSTNGHARNAEEDIVDHPLESVSGLFNKGESFIRTQTELIKLQAILKGAELGTQVTLGLVLIVGLGLALIFVSIGLALVVGSWIQSAAAGFFLVGAFYLLIVFFLYQFGGNWMRNRFSRAILNSLMK